MAFWATTQGTPGMPPIYGSLWDVPVAVYLDAMLIDAGVKAGR